jgi:serine/threonine-protein kinase
MTDQIDRRKFLATATTTALSAGLAGCSGGGGGGGDGGDGGASIPDDVQSRVDEFVTSDNYDGEIVDATGQDEVVVEVGAQGNGGAFAFAPPAVAISSSSTVSFQWTGEGGQHNVVSVDSSDIDTDSGNPATNTDPFEQSFDNTGVCLYECKPHASLNMNGAVVVLE